MPEGLEVEIYRRAAERLAGRTVAEVWADERCSMPGLATMLAGVTFERADRVGKLLVLRSDGASLGVHFGMTGRIVVDGTAPIGELEYGSGRDDPGWDRLVVDLVDGGRMRVNDPRRWSRFTLDPDTAAFGPDLLAITRDELAGALAGTRRCVKAVLLDQRRVAGLGNLCVDELLWHASLSPVRPAPTLADAELDGLHLAMREQLPAMLERGGSHTGVLSPAVRAALPTCPADGSPLRRRQVAGRTTVWCERHQP